MNMTHISIEVEQELAPLSGYVQWVSEYGIGVGFDEPERIDDATLEHLPTTIQWIVWVNLSQTRIADRAVKLLSAAARLEAIHLTATALTITGVIELIESLPQERIKGDGSNPVRHDDCTEEPTLGCDRNRAPGGR